jgi:hypothetical protein
MKTDNFVYKIRRYKLLTIFISCSHIPTPELYFENKFVLE